MKVGQVEIGSGPLTIIAGPCLAESEALCLEVAEHMRDLCTRLGFQYIFKASFDKANRTSGKSFRGPGLHEGMKTLDAVKRKTGLPVTTDVHESTQIDAVAQIASWLRV